MTAFLIHLAVSLLALGLGAYAGLLVTSWPVLNDPDHFHRQSAEESAWVAWAQSLVVTQ